MSEKKAPRVAVVTGASSGIGRAAAEEFAKHGYTVVVVARRKALLVGLVKELEKNRPHGHFIAAPCDISDWKQVSALAAELETKLPYINVLVNNAGAYDYQSLEKSSLEKLDEMIDVNVRGVIYMSKAFLPHLKKAISKGHRAKVVNVSSVGGLLGFSNMAVYTATKFAVTGFSRALRRELKADGVDVASIHPGPVQTKEGEGAKKSIVMLPHQIASQIYELSKSKQSQRISHPAFYVLNFVEYFSPGLVDKVLKRIL